MVVELNFGFGCFKDFTILVSFARNIGCGCKLAEKNVLNNQGFEVFTHGPPDIPCSPSMCFCFHFQCYCGTVYQHHPNHYHWPTTGNWCYECGGQLPPFRCPVELATKNGSANISISEKYISPFTGEIT